MNADQARDFLRQNTRAVLGTSRRDGTVQLSPILVVLDESGDLLISTRESSAKVKNLRRDARATLCVMNPQFFGPWAQVEGTTEIISLPDAMDGLVHYYRLAAGEHSDWDDYRAAMVRDQRVLVRFHIERATLNNVG